MRSSSVFCCRYNGETRFGAVPVLRWASPCGERTGRIGDIVDVAACRVRAGSCGCARRCTYPPCACAGSRRACISARSLSSFGFGIDGMVSGNDNPVLFGVSAGQYGIYPGKLLLLVILLAGIGMISLSLRYLSIIGAVSTQRMRMVAPLSSNVLVQQRAGMVQPILLWHEQPAYCRGIRGCPAGGTSLSSAPGGCK